MCVLLHGLNGLVPVAKVSPVKVGQNSFFYQKVKKMGVVFG
jgi:hypothetical protein